MAQFRNWTSHSEGTSPNQDPNISVLRISPEGGFGDTLLESAPMQWSGVDIPEIYEDALTRGGGASLRDAAADLPVARFARALVRAGLGDERGARADLEDVVSELGDAARVELAMLDLRRRADISGALLSGRAIASKDACVPPLRARALHVVGLAEGKLRNTPAALEALLDAARLYGESGQRAGRAQAHDSVGMLLAARGRLDQAVYWYALSLADKALLGDRLGMAITLGNLGRLHLRAGRIADALECFERDLEIAEELHDIRGQARMHEDIGRAHAAAEDDSQAEAGFRRAIEIAEAHDYGDLAFFAWRDLCVLRVRAGDTEGARAAYQCAQAALPPGGEPYFRLLLSAAEAEVLGAEGDDTALERLQETVDGLSALDLPDLEIPARMRLAAMLRDNGDDVHAEQCLMRALARARRDGYARYLAPINEALSSLGLVDGVLEQESRSASTEADGAPDAYLLRRLLGSGAFGEVYRAYDPERHREVAFKRIFLERVYDPEQRRQLMESARVELDAASRVRHPGIVRVFAVGAEEGGGMYVVQEFVEGRSLRDVMDDDPAPAVGPVLGVLTEVSHALQALHDAGVVHRDLKPENVLVRPDGTPVLVDFGIAHIAANKASDEEGVLVGTLHYMAPEQMRGQVVDHRADLYALGAMAFEWLSGRLPIEPVGDDLLSQFRHMFTAEPDALDSVRADVPTGIASLVMALLEKDPHRRPQSAAEAARSFSSLF